MVTVTWLLAQPELRSAADARRAHAELTRLFFALLEAHPRARVNVTFHAAAEELRVNGTALADVRRLCDTLSRSSYLCSPRSAAAGHTSTARAHAALRRTEA
jgi:hypothetical protein